MGRKAFCWFFCLLMMAGGVWAAGSDFEIGEISLSAETWGQQQATFTLKNVSVEFKTVIAGAEVAFSDHYLSPVRKTRAVVFLEPEQSADVVVPVNIPGNYGTCVVSLNLSDVVDTLDAVLESQVFHRQQFTLTFPMPEGLTKVVGEYLHVPAFVEKNDYYDNYFGRAMTFLLANGRTVDEVASLTGCDIAYVDNAITDYVDFGYFAKTPDGYQPSLMVIDQSQVQSVRSAIDKTVASLVGLITTNMSGYDSTIAAMIVAGTLTKDPDNAIDPGAVLHHKYPVVLGLLLWDLLGREFVNNGEPFNIFEGSDPCNAQMGDFMYLVSGGADDVGSSFYYYLHTKKAERFHTGIGAMPILCDPRYRDLRERNKYVNWSFSREKPAVFHTYTDDKVRAPLSILMDGTVPTIEGLRQAVDDLAASTGQTAYGRGARLWCWSLVVTDVMNQLERDGIVVMEGDGLYSLTKANLKR